MSRELLASPINYHDPIILLHGWGMNASVFKPLCDNLAGVRKTLCIDLPGYGSSRGQVDLVFEDQAASVGANLPRGTLLGWSMGGLYATEIVRQNPDQFSQLILVCCNPCFVQRPDWICAVNESVLEAFADDLSKGWSSTIRRFLSLQMLGDKNARQLVRDLVVKIEAAGEPSADVLRYGLELLKTLDIRATLAALDVPIKIILGERDVLVPATLIKEILKVNPRIQVELMPDSAHVPFLSHPDHFISLI